MKISEIFLFFHVIIGLNFHIRIIYFEKGRIILNILFFLTPKSDVSFIYDDITVLEALNMIRESGHSSLPLIDREGHYRGTLTEGDFLWDIIDVHNNTPPIALQSLPVSQLRRRITYKAVNINENIDDLLTTVYAQNFVPIIDDRRIFIGIVTRQDIMKHYCSCSQRQDLLLQKV